MRTTKSEKTPHFCGFEDYKRLSGKSKVAETESAKLLAGCVRMHPHKPHKTEAYWPF